jgi:hypothetical protein
VNPDLTPAGWDTTPRE